MKSLGHCAFAVLTAQTLLAALVTNLATAQQTEPLRVMTFNIWVGGESGRQPLSQTAKVIEAAQADIIGLQEVCGRERNGKRPDNGQKVAALLGMNYFSQGDDDTAVMTRHKIVSHTPRKWGVKIELPSGRPVWLFNVHFSASPYQPYQLLKIPYNDAPFFDSAEDAVQSARATREKQVTSMLEELNGVRDEGTSIFVTGDFNEPSVLDWTDAVKTAEQCPVAVEWPTTAAIHDAGFVDAYREAHPDPVAAPGYTWTPITSVDDPQDRHDRIDLVLVGGRGGRVVKADVVGEVAVHADIVVAPYPSDHRAVVATVELK